MKLNRKDKNRHKKQHNDFYIDTYLFIWLKILFMRYEVYYKLCIDG